MWLLDGRQPESAYAGSRSCRECHRDAYVAWRKSNHSKAERPVDPAQDRQFFVPERKFRAGGIDCVAGENANGFFVSTIGADGRRANFKPERIIGVNPLRQLLIPADGGRLQVTSLAYDPKRLDWFDVYGDENRRYDEWGYWANRGMTWNAMCGTCHNTGYDKNYEVETDTYNTQLFEHGVGCESCHGPSAAHVRWREKKLFRMGRDPITKVQPWRIIDTCGACHTRRIDFTGKFTPGDEFLDHYFMALPDHSNVYYPDGQIWDEDFEFSSFRMSRMYHEGVRCIDCHDPHTGFRYLEGNPLCMRCHELKIEASHSHHDPAKPGSKCTDCHMPITTYMARHPRHDHGMTIPDPELTRDWNVPNACMRCHADKGLNWNIEWTNRWYKPPAIRNTGRRARAFARAKANDLSAIPEVIRIAREDPYPIWRGIAIGMLGPWADRPEVTALGVASLRDSDAVVRAQAVQLLEPVAGQVREALLPMLNDALRCVRIRTAASLREMLPRDHSAISELLPYLRLSADHPAGALVLGSLYSEWGDPARAITLFQRALKWDNRAEPVWRALAVALSRSGRGDEAVKVLQQGCEVLTSSAELKHTLGLGLADLGNLDGAIGAFRDAVRIDPDYARSWYNLGLALQQQRRWPEALEALKKAEKLQPTSPDYSYAISTVLLNIGQTQEAERAARRTLMYNPNHQGAQEVLSAIRQRGAAPAGRE